MLTFSASQLGAVVALIIGALCYLGQLVVQWHQTSNLTSSLAGVAAAERELFFSLEFWAILFMTVLYYAVGEWAAEERDYYKLRKVKWAVFEFWWRVGLAGAFGVAAAGTPGGLRFGLLTPSHASALFLVVIYLGFLFWDIVVFEGGKTDLRWRIIIGDFAGGCLILTCLWLHYTSWIGAIFALLAAFGLNLIFLMLSLQDVKFGKRISHRECLR